jgi:hypothetical protein
LIDLFAHPHAKVCRNLIVSTASGMQFPPGIADQCHQARLDEGMDILCRNLIQVPVMSACLFENCLKPMGYALGLVSRQNAGAGQTVAMRNTRSDIDFDEPPVKAEGAIKFNEILIGLARKASAP